MKRNYLLLVLLSLFIVGITSCDDDDDHYSLGKYWIAMGEIDKSDGDAQLFEIELDNDDRLIPVAGHLHYINRVEDNDRVLVNYTILDDADTDNDPSTFYVRINDIDKVLAKGVITMTEAIQDSIGNDPIHVEDAWVSSHYLNFELKFSGGCETHYINLVNEPADNPEGSDVLKLQLRHNDRGDQCEAWLSALVSFDLNSIEHGDNESIDIEISGKEYNDEDYSYTFTYEFNGD
ncbi:hypothetical protein EYV94_23940 [Puteibacter caeruleilacunae]|nr:hypothetical protein EYV94_23940 [Puteibacter caeruleilacunae]